MTRRACLFSCDFRFYLCFLPSRWTGRGLVLDFPVFTGIAMQDPIDAVDDIPPGPYRVQALLHRYESFERADGHTLKLPMDRGEGQQWNRAPGNLYSAPREVVLQTGGDQLVHIELDQIIPPIDPPRTPSTFATSESEATF